MSILHVLVLVAAFVRIDGSIVEHASPQTQPTGAAVESMHTGSTAETRNIPWVDVDAALLSRVEGLV